MRSWPGILLVAGVAVLAGGCGGGSKPPAVASLGPATSTTTTTSGNGGESAGGKQLGSFVRFAQCMQDHGAPVQVAQNGHGVSINGNASSTVGSPQIKAAQQACQKYLPGGGPQQLTPAQQAQNMKLLLAMAKCVRAHGIANFPDPSSQGTFQITQATGIDPNSSQFQSAMQACRPANGARVAVGISVASAGPNAGKSSVQTAQGGR